MIPTGFLSRAVAWDTVELGEDVEEQSAEAEVVEAEAAAVVDAAAEGTEESELIEVGHCTAEMATHSIRKYSGLSSGSNSMRPVFDRRSQRAQKGNSHCQAY